MKQSWVIVMLVCVLGCACGNPSAETTSAVVTDIPVATNVPSANRVTASPTVVQSPTPAASPVAGVAIYLTAGDITPADLLPNSESGDTGELLPLDELPLKPSPVISQGDIVTYDAATHEFTLTPKAHERLADLGFPIAGPPFVMTVDGDPLYAGAFWTPLSSQSFDGVVIMLWPDGMAANGGVYRIELGYPGPGFFLGEDPRDDPRIFGALEATGKLK